MLIRKNAFTFAELMISLTVIAIITVILYPTLSEMAPNNNQYLFKSAYRTIETTTSDIMNTSRGNTLPTATRESLCNAFCERLNTISIKGWNQKLTKDAGGNDIPERDPVTDEIIMERGDSDCSNCMDFTTSNGMRWAFTVRDPSPAVANDEIGYILVDVNTLNNKKTGDTSANVAGNVNVMPANTPALNAWNDSTDGVFYTGDDTTQDTFLFIINSAGKITPYGTVARNHIQSGN